MESGEGWTLPVMELPAVERVLGFGPGKGQACGWVEPRWPSLMATVLRVDMDVVVEFGVPLRVWC